jgi:malate-CoA ligase subunit beta
MDIHEYQAKEMLKKFGVNVPRGGIAYSPEQAVYRASELSGDKLGGEGTDPFRRARQGRRRSRSAPTEEIVGAAAWMLGRRLVTHQTGPQGKLVTRLYVEEATNIAQELYLGFVMDRKLRARGGRGLRAGRHGDRGDFRRNPTRSSARSSTPAVGMQNFQAREIAFSWVSTRLVIPQAARRSWAAYAAMSDTDAIMVEINPLVVTGSGEVVALDAKLSFDDNALFRLPDASELRDKSQEDPRETDAADRGLNYIGLEGEIGCIVNGAGLAMATLDMIKMAGGEPANFLDVGGGASPERVLMAFKPCSTIPTWRRSLSTSSPASTAATGSRRAWCARCKSLS